MTGIEGDESPLAVGERRVLTLRGGRGLEVGVRVFFETGRARGFLNDDIRYERVESGHRLELFADPRIWAGRTGSIKVCVRDSDDMQILSLAVRD
ncbi:MAG: hypothetical protein R3F20_09090 [Planctomycetota bacterium]